MTNLNHWASELRRRKRYLEGPNVGGSITHTMVNSDYFRACYQTNTLPADQEFDKSGDIILGCGSDGRLPLAQYICDMCCGLLYRYGACVEV